MGTVWLAGTVTCHGFDVRVGARVAAGTIIGRVGATGCALGSHLHFAIRRGMTFVDPLRYLPPR